MRLSFADRDGKCFVGTGALALDVALSERQVRRLCEQLGDPPRGAYAPARDAPRVQRGVIERCVAALHLSPACEERLLFLRLGFDDGTGVTFGSASDGYSLLVDDGPLRAYDMAEYGRVEVRRFRGLAVASGWKKSSRS